MGRTLGTRSAKHFHEEDHSAWAQHTNISYCAHIVVVFFFAMKGNEHGDFVM